MTPDRHERRYVAILEAAESLFIEKGFGNARLGEIVRRSGGSLATLYQLFGNKQGLLRAIAIRWRDETIQRRAEHGIVSGKPIRDILIDYARDEIDMWQSPRSVALVRMLVSESLRDRDFAIQIYRDIHLPFVAHLSDVFANWGASGAARIDDPDAAAHLFLSIISGDTLRRILGFDAGVMDETEIRWRMKPFFKYFSIA